MSDESVDTRFVLFEVGTTIYGLPISDVLEVAEVEAPAGIPTVPRRTAWVTNHHGDALPVVARDALFESEALSEPSHLLVLGGGGGQTARLGLPVDRVLGLVDGPAARLGGTGLVVERRPIEGRLVSVLDVRRLLERAAGVLGAAAAPVAAQGGRG